VNGEQRLNLGGRVGSLDVNWALQHSHTPMAGGGDFFTIRSLRFGMIAV
jgi:hypothetical protein